ncbi:MULTISPECIES: hypothetical protein [unclassified Bacillus (in: firmicutes)]|uniref:hypothetical protein n=1 Tax=unclassified Bacillus (in: firmicutes) TaxID=185979 RepID=UPI000BF1AB85|nr:MULTISPECIES: hypothetical protein [unclassified Bacillus (in: firmicutes)]PEJ56422.1 hypothetical protein CN692_17640 [Bacillus sp. AFS002410]PEL14165.1 hypothetical protein CN601_01035 [Bacillus sp. AFS017336]
MTKHKRSRDTDDNHIHVATNSYLDTSENDSNKINYDDGGSPYLDTSDDASSAANTRRGAPYLNT